MFSVPHCPLWYTVILLELDTRSDSLNHDMVGDGIPVAQHSKDAISVTKTIVSSGSCTIDGGTKKKWRGKEEEEEQNKRKKGEFTLVLLVVKNTFFMYGVSCMLFCIQVYLWWYGRISMGSVESYIIHNDYINRHPQSVYCKFLKCASTWNATCARGMHRSHRYAFTNSRIWPQLKFEFKKVTAVWKFIQKNP